MKYSILTVFIIVLIGLCTCLSSNTDDVEANMIVTGTVQNYDAITAEFVEPLPLTRVPFKQLNAGKFIHVAIFLITVFWENHDIFLVQVI